MTAEKRCELCDTMLKFEQDGQRFAFTAHTPELCRVATKQRIAGLQQAIANVQAAAERAIRGVVRQADRVLADAGLETLTQRGKRQEAQVLAGLLRAGMLDPTTLELKL